MCLNKKALLWLMAVLALFAVKCLCPPTDDFKRQTAAFLGLQEAWVQALARGEQADSRDKREVFSINCKIVFLSAPGR